MAAEAVINLKAVDSTRGAFESVKASLGKLQSAVSSARSVVKGFFTLFGVKMAFDAFNNALRDIEKNSERLGTTKEELDKVTRATGAIDEAFNFLKNGAASLVNGILDVKDSLTGVTQTQSASIADKIKADRDLPKIKDLQKSLAELKQEFAMIGATPAEQFQILADAIDEANNAANDPNLANLTNDLMRQNEAQKLVNQRTQIASKVLDDYNQSQKDAEDAFQSFRMKQLSADEKQAKIADLINKNRMAFVQLQAKIPENFDFSAATAEDIANMLEVIRLNKEYNKLMGEREVLETTLQKIGRQAGESIAQSLEDAVFVGGKLSEVLKNLANDLLRIAFRESVTSPLGTILGKSFSKGLTDLFRADGGPVGAGSPYIVGERGPELFVPRSSGSIVSNDNLAGATMGGGGGVNITYNISGGMNRAELMPILEQERKRLKAEIPDMVRRGGAYRAAFA